MTSKDILDATRSDYLYDTKLPQLWEDEELLRHLNKVLNEWCRETFCLRDSSTEAICKILLLANQHTYTMDSRIVSIYRGRLASGYPKIDPKETSWLEDNVYAWETLTGDPRYLVPDIEPGNLRVVPYFGTEGYFTGTMAAVAGTKTFTLAGQNFSTYLSDGDQVDIDGTLNDGVFTIASATADSFIVDEAIQTETVSTVVRKVMDTLWISVARLPLVQLTKALWATQSPEIRADFHDKLPDGICREAYLKHDSDSFDTKASDKHRALFEINKNKAKKGVIALRSTRRILSPHPGSI